MTLRNASAKDAGYFTYSATNNLGTVSAEMRLTLAQEEEKNHVKELYDDITIHEDNTVVSGDITDQEFVDMMVKNHFQLYHSNRWFFIFKRKKSRGSFKNEEIHEVQNIPVISVTEAHEEQNYPVPG